MLCYVMLCYAMLCYAMLCYAMLCYVMLCYVMLCYVRELFWKIKIHKKIQAISQETKSGHSQITKIPLTTLFPHCQNESVQNYSYENVFHSQILVHANETNFHLKVFV